MRTGKKKSLARVWEKERVIADDESGCFLLGWETKRKFGKAEKSERFCRWWVRLLCLKKPGESRWCTVQTTLNTVCFTESSESLTYKQAICFYFEKFKLGKRYWTSHKRFMVCGIQQDIYTQPGAEKTPFKVDILINFFWGEMGIKTCWRIAYIFTLTNNLRLLLCGGWDKIPHMHHTQSKQPAKIF